MVKKFEDFIFPDKDNMRILKYAEYRKGSHENGQLIQDLMMLLRYKREKNKDVDELILTKNDLKNIDTDKLKELSKDKKQLLTLGISFDIDFLTDGKIRFYNLNNVEKNTRPWENKDVNLLNGN